MLAGAFFPRARFGGGEEPGWSRPLQSRPPLTAQVWGGVTFLAASSLAASRSPLAPIGRPRCPSPGVGGLSLLLLGDGVDVGADPRRRRVASRRISGGALALRSGVSASGPDSGRLQATPRTEPPGRCSVARRSPPRPAPCPGCSRGEAGGRGGGARGL